MFDFCWEQQHVINVESCLCFLKLRKQKKIRSMKYTN